eukprot:CAMPEP_0117447418 /NCGR_PEP_ID=MMETSP0759-20121206/6865_1 /TAXON_ID=63605 /ORGANISM="Percolomonas cosmopolitus, Strain WS" /LENGTH=547 /DNA_ID=CAMNT_0005239753 /DNA_START=196 /DNA_END=1840 /DNA_ORIENTATION=+
MTTTHEQQQQLTSSMQQQQPHAGDDTTTTTTDNLAKIRSQLEYYFSAENLSQDSYLLSQMTNLHYVPVNLLAQFHKMRQLTQSLQDILVSIEESPNLELDESKQFVRPINLKVFELKSVRVIGIGMSGPQLQNILTQYVPDMSAVTIHADFVTPMQQATWGHDVEILRENILKRHTQALSPSSLKVNAKPFVPTTAPQQQQRYNSNNNRHFGNRQENSRRSSSVGGSSSASVSSNDQSHQQSSNKSQHLNKNNFQRNHYNRNTREGRRNYNKDGTSPQNNQINSAGGRRKFSQNNKDRQSPAASTSPGAANSTHSNGPSPQNNNQNNKDFNSRNKSHSNTQQRNGNVSKKNPEQKTHNQNKQSHSSPAPSLNANNYPSLSKTGSKSEQLKQDDSTASAPVVNAPVTSPGGFSFAEIAMKAKDVQAPKRAKVAAATVPSSATSSEASSIKSAEAPQEQKGAPVEAKPAQGTDKRKTSTTTPGSSPTDATEFIVPKTKKGRKPAQQNDAKKESLALSQQTSEDTPEPARSPSADQNSYASIVLSSGASR